MFSAKKRKKVKSTNHQILPKSLICCWVGLPSSATAIHCEAATISTRCTLPILCHASKRSSREEEFICLDIDYRKRNWGVFWCITILYMLVRLYKHIPSVSSVAFIHSWAGSSTLVGVGGAAPPRFSLFPPNGHNFQRTGHPQWRPLQKKMNRS